MDLGSPGPDVQLTGKPWKLKKGAEITSPPCARSRERKKGVTGLLAHKARPQKGTFASEVLGLKCFMITPNSTTNWKPSIDCVSLCGAFSFKLICRVFALP